MTVFNDGNIFTCFLLFSPLSMLSMYRITIRNKWNSMFLKLMLVHLFPYTKASEKLGLQNIQERS